MMKWFKKILAVMAEARQRQADYMMASRGGTQPVPVKAELKKAKKKVAKKITAKKKLAKKKTRKSKKSKT